MDAYDAARIGHNQTLVPVLGRATDEGLLPNYRQTSIQPLLPVEYAHVESNEDRKLYDRDDFCSYWQDAHSPLRDRDNHQFYSGPQRQVLQLL